MANPTPDGINESGNNDYKTRLRSYQRPLRRSPRFLPQFDNNTPLITSNKQRINAIKKTHFKSAPNLRNPTQISTPKKAQRRFLMKCCNEPLRSIENLHRGSPTNRPSSSSCKTRVKFPPNFVSPTQVLTPLKTPQGCSTKCPNESLRSIGNLQGSLRRSRRLSSFSSFAIAKESVESVCQRKPSLWLSSSAKVLEGKENVSFDGFNDYNCQSSRQEGVEPLKEKRSLRLMGSVKLSEGKEIVGNENDENRRDFRKECVEHVKERWRSSWLMGSVEASEGRENAGIDGLKEENYKGFSKELVKPVKEKMQLHRLIGNAKEKGREQYVDIDGLNDKKANNANLTAKVVKERKVLDKEKVANDGHMNLKRKRGAICKRNIESEKLAMGKYSDFAEWTREQEAALQKAYLVAKPSPHFWKKVARMVPGKSAQACFDRVNGSLVTPPQPQPRSRSKKTHPSPISNFSLSGSKPFQHSLPFVKKLSSRKKSLAAQKTVRKLLRKHSTNDQNHEADHFSVFETSPIQLAMDSPESSSSVIPSPPCSHQKCSGGSSSTHKMPSRFKPSSQDSRLSAISPEVLKRIKNIGLHEKYIDQLHNREARRKFAAASRVVKSGEKVELGIVKAARNALMTEAKEVIFQFQQLQANSQYIDDNDDDEEEEGDDDDDE